MKEIDNELLAVISAALAMLSTQSGNKLVVRSYRRINRTSPVWNTVGRDEIINGRL